MDITKPDDMRRLLLSHNIENLTRFLASGKPIDNPDYFRGLIRDDRRELAMLNSHQYGASDPDEYHIRQNASDACVAPSDMDLDELATDLPCMIFDTGPDLKILKANKAFESITGMSRAEMAGRPVYEIFPENPAAPESECIAATFESVGRVVTSKRADIIAMQRYDIRNENGGFTKRYWRIENMPILDSEGDVAFIRNCVEDITEEVLAIKTDGPVARMPL